MHTHDLDHSNCKSQIAFLTGQVAGLTALLVALVEAAQDKPTFQNFLQASALSARGEALTHTGEYSEMVLHGLESALDPFEQATDSIERNFTLPLPYLL